MTNTNKSIAERNTAIYGYSTLVEIIKKTAKTSLVRNLTGHDDKPYRVKNCELKTGKLEVLTDENASRVSRIIAVNNPEWGVKVFNYNAQDLNDGEKMHTWGVGANSSLLADNEMHCWLVFAWR